jgi:hypothetical protein
MYNVNSPTHRARNYILPTVQPKCEKKFAHAAFCFRNAINTRPSDRWGWIRNWRRSLFQGTQLLRGKLCGPKLIIFIVLLTLFHLKVQRKQCSGHVVLCRWNVMHVICGWDRIGVHCLQSRSHLNAQLQTMCRALQSESNEKKKKMFKRKWLLPSYTIFRTETITNLFWNFY